jgi:hypothetical protein
MIGAFAAHRPSVGIFWVVETGPGEARLLTAGCSLETAELYGEFLTFADGHYEVWERWRNINYHDPALRAIVRTFEYEDWPRGRIVFDQMKKHFILFADRKLMLSGAIARIRTQFAISPDGTTVKTDFHYQSAETPGPLP